MQTTQVKSALPADVGRSAGLATPDLQLIGAAILALVVIYAVGFSAIMPVHNAAHDARHSASFPCH